MQEPLDRGNEGLALRVAEHVDDYAVTEALVVAGFGVSLVRSIATGQSLRASSRRGSRHRHAAFE